MPNTHQGIRGPAIFLAQFIGDEAPFDSLDGIALWAAEQGYQAIQLPTADSRFIDLHKAAESQSYCDELNVRIPANVTGHSGDRDRFAHGLHAGESFVR